MKRIYFFIGCLLLVFMGLSSQRIQAQNPEYLYAHFDKDFYVSGEDVWFSLHFLAPAARQSEIVYVELFSPEGEEIIRHTLKVENNVAVGDLVLPANLTEAYYTFRAYTKWNLNFSPQVFFEKHIPVYNPIRDISALPKLNKNESYVPLSNPELKLNLGKGEYEPREMVQLSLSSSTDALSNVSVSVTDLTYANYDSTGSLEDYVEELSKQNTPEHGSELTPAETSLKRTFHLRHPETKEPVNSNFIMGFVKLNHQKLTRIAQEGLVDFPLNNFYDTTVIQIFDANPFLPTYIPLITPIEEQFSLEAPTLKRGSPPLTELVKYYLLEYQHRFQLSKLFGNMDLIRAKAEKVIASEFSPTNIYEVGNFIDLGGIEALVKQAIPPITFKRAKYRKGKYFPPRLKLYVPHKEPYKNIKVIKDKPTLLLVNDYFTYDTEAVLNIEYQNMERVEVYNTVQNLAKQFGPLGEFGVVAFITRDGQTPPEITETGNNLKVAGFYRPRLLTNIDYSSTKHLSSKIPDFRPTIYWNPQVELQANTITELEFPSGDQHGRYLVRVEGVLANGQAISSEVIFTLAY